MLQWTVQNNEVKTSEPPLPCLQAWLNDIFTLVLIFSGKMEATAANSTQHLAHHLVLGNLSTVFLFGQWFQFLFKPRNFEMP